MFSGFHTYDDEGYFLLTLREYLVGHSLYTGLFTTYGPFYYEVLGGVFRLLGLDVGHDAGRMVTLAVWLIASLLAGAGAYRLTSSMWLGLAAQLLTFHVLGVLTNEPMQPSGLIAILLMAMVAAASARSARPRATAAVIGGIVAAACLIKINAGVFMGLAATFAFAAAMKGRWRVLLPVTGAVLVLSPFVLMAGLLSQDWVRAYTVVVALSAVALTQVSIAWRPARMAAASGGWLVAGGVLVVIVLVGIAAIGGTRLYDLVNDLVFVPLRQPRLYTWPLRIGVGEVAWAAVWLVIAAVAIRFKTHPWMRGALPGVMRIAAGAFTWLVVLLLPSPAFMLALPLAWIAAAAPEIDAESPTDAYARQLVPTLALMFSMDAYPVAGTSLPISALALVPLGAVMVNDGIRQLRAWATSHNQPSALKVAAAAAPALLILNIAVLQLFTFLGASEYSANEPLGLRGAQAMRLPPQQAAALRGVTAAIDQRCDAFITEPGLDSFYIWSGSLPPAPVVDGVWLFALDDGEQRSLVSQIQGLPNLCVVRSQAAVDFWAEGRPIPQRPLVEYIDASFVPAATFGDYEVLVKRPQ